MSEAASRDRFGAARWAAIGATGLLFVLCMDAQWLKVDDFTMARDFAATPLRQLLSDIAWTRTTPHVRFAFVQHLLLLPLYRWGVDDRAAVNAFYLLVVAALLGSGALLALRLRREPLLWCAAWAVFAGALLSTNTWNTLEFKAATYLCTAFLVLAVLGATTWALLDAAGPRRRLLAAWTALAILAVHTAEVTLFAVALLGLALVVARRMRAIHLAAVGAWPLLYWAANRALSPRPAVVVGERTLPSLPGAIPAMARVAWKFARSDVQLGIAVLAGAALVALWPGASGRRRVALASIVLALPVSGVALELLVQTQMPGVTLERYVMYFQLCVAAGAVALLCAAQEVLPRRASVIIAVALLAGGAVVVRNRLPRLLRYVDGRREELQLTFALQRATRAAAADAARSGREVVVFVRDWRVVSDGGDWMDATFLGASWSRDAFARRWVCPSAAACPAITFVPNTEWMAAPLDAAEREALCQRVPRATVLVVSDRRAGAQEVRDAPRDAGACERWLRERNLVAFAPETLPAPRRTASR